MMRNSGKTLTIFIVLSMVLLICSTSIGFFLYNKEVLARKELQTQVDAAKYELMKLQGDLKEARHQLSLAQDKAKEADDKINNLMDEIDVNDGLRKELKTENASLKDALEAAKKEKQKAQDEVEAARNDAQEAQKRFKEASELFKTEQDKAVSLQESLDKLKAENEDAQKEIKALKSNFSDENGIPAKTAPPKIELDKIVVNPNDGTRGKVLSVDKDSDFIIANLGVKQGVKPNDVLGVYRGDEYLGDVRVSKVQQELCAADLIPPFSSRKVRKNDTVVFRP